MSKHISSMSVHHYSVPVVIVALLLMTDEFFANCRCPNVLVDMVAATVVHNVNVKAAISISVHNAPTKWTLKFRLTLS